MLGLKSVTKIFKNNSAQKKRVLDDVLIEGDQYHPDFERLISVIQSMQQWNGKGKEITREEAVEKAATMLANSENAYDFDDTLRKARVQVNLLTRELN